VIYSELILNGRQCLLLVDIEPYYRIPMPLPFVRTRLAWYWAVGTHDSIMYEIKWQDAMLSAQLVVDLPCRENLSAARRHPPRCQDPVGAPPLPTADKRTRWAIHNLIHGTANAGLQRVQRVQRAIWSGKLVSHHISAAAQEQKKRRWSRLGAVTVL
jgi:hypothetical protein